MFVILFVCLSVQASTYNIDDETGVSLLPDQPDSPTVVYRNGNVTTVGKVTYAHTPTSWVGSDGSSKIDVGNTTTIRPPRKPLRYNNFNSDYKKKYSIID